MGDQHKKRASKYDEKLKIDASFEDAIKALMGVPNQNQNKMQPISDAVEFTFPEWDMNNPKLPYGIEKFKFLYEKYSIKIPKTYISKVAVELELINDTTKDFVIEVIAAKIIKDQPLLLQTIESDNPTFGVNPDKGTGKKRTAHFNPEKDVECDLILVYCEPIDTDVAVSVTVFKK